MYCCVSRYVIVIMLCICANSSVKSVHIDQRNQRNNHNLPGKAGQDDAIHITLLFMLITTTDKRNIWKIVYLCNFIHCFHEPVRNKMILAFACKVPNRNLISHALACKIEPKELLNACLQRRKESFEEKLSCSVWLLVIFVSFLFSFWTTLTTLLHQSLPCLMGCY